MSGWTIDGQICRWLNRWVNRQLIDRQIDGQICGNEWVDEQLMDNLMEKFMDGWVDRQNLMYKSLRKNKFVDDNKLVYFVDKWTQSISGVLSTSMPDCGASARGSLHSPMPAARIQGLPGAPPPDPWLHPNIDVGCALSGFSIGCTLS
jgi:hypothetical protein